VVVFTDAGQTEHVRALLEQQAVPVVASETALVPKTSVQLDERTADQTMRLIERLEELDDVQHVYSNSDVSDEVAASLAG
jgi:transcriptional/translational regulatory protein YebC/TACO1